MNGSTSKSRASLFIEYAESLGCLSYITLQEKGEKEKTQNLKKKKKKPRFQA